MIDEQPRQIEHARHPRDDGYHMQRLDPFVHPKYLAGLRPPACFTTCNTAVLDPISALPTTLV
jgi:hypothetical protein